MKRTQRMKRMNLMSMLSMLYKLFTGKHSASDTKVTNSHNKYKEIRRASTEESQSHGG